MLNFPASLAPRIRDFAANNGICVGIEISGHRCIVKCTKVGDAVLIKLAH